MPLSKSFNILTDIAKTTQKLAGIRENLPEVYKNTISDMKARLPGKVSNAVTWLYNIKKKEIKYNFKKDFTNSSIGGVTLRGEDINSMALNYYGRRLTPLHFGMRTNYRKLSKEELLERKKVRNKGKKTPRIRYKVSLDVRGIRKNLPHREPTSIDSALFLFDNRLPAWRLTNKSTPIKVVKTISLVHMLSNKNVRRKIEKERDELLEKRLNHHMARFVKKIF